jgi:adenylate cyclase
MYRLRLLGSPCIRTDDGELLTGPATQRHRLALLALLALTRGGGLSREKAMAYLWPERDSEHARQLLNQAVYNLRRFLGEEALLSSGDDLRLNTNFLTADVHEFESAVEQRDHGGAVAVYHGPFLDGFFLSETAEFEQWVERERERLAGGYARALEGLARSAEEERDFGRAVEWWRARAGHDRFDTSVAISLIRALDAHGNRAGALHHAVLHERLLLEEFGIESPPELRGVVEHLRRRSASTQEPLRADAPEPGAASLRTGDLSRVVEDDRAPAPAGEPISGPWPGEAKGGNRRAAGIGQPRRLPTVVGSGLVTLLLVLLLVRWDTSAPEPSSTPLAEPSIAVLPLVNFSDDQADDVLAAAMTEELIGRLAQADGLRVIASTSVFAFRDRRLDIRGIADSLGVGYILEGGLRKVGSSGRSLRVQVRLVDARDRATLWARTFDRPFEEIFAVQDDIARAVTLELGLGSGDVSEPSRRQPTQNVAAYELYIRGSDPALLRSDSGALAGLEHFRQAVALDSTYAAAYAGLGRMHNRVAYGAPLEDRSFHYEMAEAAAIRAVALDESLAEAHATLGLMRMAAFDFAAAERHLMRAIALDPAQARFHEWIVTLLLWTGRKAEALTHATLALEMDPLAPSARAEMARALLFNDRCTEALDHLEMLVELQPPLLRAAPLAAQCLAGQRRWAEAIALLRPLAQRGEPSALSQLAFVLARSGQTEEALEIQRDLLERWRSGRGGALQVALTWAGLGDLDQTFVWFERSIADRSLVGGPGDPAPLMIIGPLFEDVRRDPRFEGLRERIGGSVGSGM